MHRLGARAWIARIMLSWGLVSAAACLFRRLLVSIQRFFLGIAEAGFFPGVILYPDLLVSCTSTRTHDHSVHDGQRIGGRGQRRLGLDHVRYGRRQDLSGWRWMFLIEGLPTVLVTGLVLLGVTEYAETGELVESR